MSGCMFPDCSRPVLRRRCCKPHYEQLRRKGLHQVVTRVCRCGQLLASKHKPGRPAGVVGDAGFGQCYRCYVPVPKPSVDRELGETPYQPGERWTRDELMAEWDFMRGWVPFEEFGARVGIKQDSWKQAFRRAKAAGDPRARLAACDVSTWSDPASWTAGYCDSTSRERARQRRARQKQGAAA